MRYILILLAVIPAFTQAQIFDLEDMNKTVTAFDLAFKEKRLEYLQAIASDEFLHSDAFIRLGKLTKQYSLNLGYTQTRCLKEFDIEKSSQKLIVRFIQKDNFWYVEDAYIQGSKEVVRFPAKGFKPLAVEYNFSDFVNAVTSGEIKEFSGLAPFGGLPISFFSEYRITKNQEAKILVSNIIFHDFKNIVELGYIALKNHPKLINNKRGWLLVEFGFMDDYYSLYQEQDLFVDFLLGKGGSYDLSKRSPFFFANVASLKSGALQTEKSDSNEEKRPQDNDRPQIKESTEAANNLKEPRLISIKVPAYKPEASEPKPFFVLALEFDGITLTDKKQIRVQIKSDILECTLKQPVKYVGPKHNWLDVETNDETIIISAKPNSPYYFIDQRQLINTVLKNDGNKTTFAIQLAL